MTEIEVEHRFFPVGQGLFVAGSIQLWPSEQTCRWVYDCGSSSSKCLVNIGIDILKDDWNSQKIDLLTISHFHRDHINGVVELLNKIGAKTIMLPWAPLWHRLLIGFSQGLGAEDDFMRFLVDPVQFFIQRAEERFDYILFVMPPGDEDSVLPAESEEPGPSEGSGEGDALGVPGEPVEKDDLDGLELPYATENDVDSQDASAINKIRKMPPGKPIRFSGVWEFIPYNDPATCPSDLIEFRDKVYSLREELLVKCNEEREEALKELKSLYEEKFKQANMNNVSLMLYGGATRYYYGIAIPEKPCYYECCIYPRYGYCNAKYVCKTNASILLTGDGDLSKDAKWKALEKYLDARRARHTSIFQVPHHGSKKNWFKYLADKASPVWSIFSSDPDYRYRHPHAAVLRAFWKYNPIQVDKRHGFSLHMHLTRLLRKMA